VGKRGGGDSKKKRTKVVGETKRRGRFCWGEDLGFRVLQKIPRGSMKKKEGPRKGSRSIRKAKKKRRGPRCGTVIQKGGLKKKKAAQVGGQRVLGKESLKGNQSNQHGGEGENRYKKGTERGRPKGESGAKVSKKGSKKCVLKRTATGGKSREKRGTGYLRGNRRRSSLEKFQFLGLGAVKSPREKILVLQLGILGGKTEREGGSGVGGRGGGGGQPPGSRLRVKLQINSTASRIKSRERGGLPGEVLLLRLNTREDAMQEKGGQNLGEEGSSHPSP